MSLAFFGRVFPGNYGAVAAYAQNLTAGSFFPCVVVVIAAPVGTDVVLCGGVGDVIAGIGAIYFLRIVAGNEILPQGMTVLAVIDAETPRAVA